MAKNKNKPKREMRKRKQERKHKKMINTATTTFKQANCHNGITSIYHNENGSILWIGGWKNGATYTKNTFVIDLTGDEDKYSDTPKAYGKAAEKLLACVSNSHAGWLSLPFPDYRVPKNITTYDQWYTMATGIKEILDSGNDVLVACLGGHGRSGLFCAIVGYILHNGAGWDSPVDKIRGIHCSLSIETREQEQFVYDVLGLPLVANSLDYGTWTTDIGSGWEKCPKCGTNTRYAQSNGMCLSCQETAKKSQAPVMDITVEMLQGVKCTCKNENCLGTWIAEKCEHAVHDMIIVDGYCEACIEANEGAEKALEKAEKKSEATVMQKCDICGTQSMAAFWTGLCFSCQDIFANEAPDCHDTLTDGFPVLAHTCDDITTCKGIMKADVCRHVVHNRYIVDGLCPECYNRREMRKIKKLNTEWELP